MKREKMDLWPLMTDGLLLFLALTSTAFGVVSAYHIQAVPSALWAGAAVMTLGAVGLGNLPRYRVPTVMGVIAVWAWGLWRLWEPLVWGGARIQCDLTNTIAAKLPYVDSIAPIAELPDEMWPQVATLWLLMVGVAYALGLALLMCRVRHALPAVLWMLLPILPALCVTEAPDRVPMAGLLAVWFTLILTSLTAQRDRPGTARMRAVALVCVLIVLQMLFQRLPTQGTAQPLWAADLREAVISEAGRGDISALLTRWSGWMGSGSTEYMNLLGNSTAQTGRVALRVSGETGKYYLRGYSADVYTGRRWEPMDREAQKELEAIRETGVEPLLMLGESAAVIREYYSSGYSERREQRALLTVENVAAPGGCVYYPYGLAALPENAGFGGDSHLERTGAVWEHTFSFYPRWESVDLYHSGRVVTESMFGGGLPSEGGGEDPYRDFVYEHELQVPEDLRPILEQWLMECMGDLGYANMGKVIGSLSPENYVRYAMAFAAGQERVWEQSALEPNDRRWELLDEYQGPTQEEVEGVAVTQAELELYRTGFTMMLLELVTDRLAQTTRYDRDTPAPPAGRDYVDWFLNESGQGYCMHYATSATLLLRTAGIPARYVSGYVTQVPRRAESVEVTAHAAHAWVEVYIDGVGWYPFEVTPGFQSSAMGDIPALDSGETQAGAVPTAVPSQKPTPAPTQAVEDVGEEVSAAPSAEPVPSQTPGGQTGPEAGEAEEPGSSGVWYGVGLLLLPALAVWGRRYLLKRREERLWGEDTNAAVLYAYVCCCGLGPWGGRGDEELTALAEKARFSQHTLTQDERERGVEIFVGEVRRVQKELPVWKRPLFELCWGKRSMERGPIQKER